MSERLIVPLDPESVKRLVGNVAVLLKGAPGVEEIGDDYVIVSVPRLLGLGHRRIKLGLNIYETEEVILIVMRSGVDSIVVAVNIIDTGEGTHIVVGGGGSGRVARLVDSIINAVKKGIMERIEAAKPQVQLTPEDNKLAALQEPLPPRASLVYYDSFTPVRDVPHEAALRVVAMLGIDDYLVELTDYRGTYLARLVLRGNRITGAYAKRGNQEATGEQALALAKHPPGHRVGLRAWSLTGSTEALLYEPELLAGDKNHSIYWVGGPARLDYGGLAPNSYIIVDNYEAAVIDPFGDDRIVRSLRLTVADLSQVKHVVVTSLEAGAESGVELLSRMLPSADFMATSYWASQIASRGAATRVSMLPSRRSTIKLGKAELLAIPAPARGAATVSIYDKQTATLITGPVMGAVTPPGLWAIRASDLEEYSLAVKDYVFYSVCPREFIAWVDEVMRLDVERLAPRYGPVLEGRREVRSLLEELRRAAAERLKTQA